MLVTRFSAPRTPQISRVRSMFGDPSSTSAKLLPLTVSFLLHSYEGVDGAGVDELDRRKVDQEPGTGEERIAHGSFEPRRGFQVVLSLQHEQCDVGPRPSDFDSWLRDLDLDVRETSHHVYPPK